VDTTQKTATMTFPAKACLLNFFFPHVNLCDDIPWADAWFQVHNEAPMYCWLSQYGKGIPHLYSCNLADKFRLFKLSSLLQHAGTHLQKPFDKEEHQ